MKSGYYWVIVFPQDGWVVLQYEEGTGMFYSYMGQHAFSPEEIHTIGGKIEYPISA